MMEKLEEFAAEFPIIGEARGMGLMQAMEIVQPGGIEPGCRPHCRLRRYLQRQWLAAGQRWLVWQCCTHRAALECSGGRFGQGDGYHRQRLG